MGFFCAEKNSFVFWLCLFVGLTALRVIREACISGSQSACELTPLDSPNKYSSTAHTHTLSLSLGHKYASVRVGGVAMLL